MKSLEVKYLGMTLKNPIVVSSSGLTSSVEKVVKMEEAGAAAVVLKSLFQEQIMHEAASFGHNDMYPEAHDYINSYVQDHSVDEYLKLIRDCKSAVSIPVIASINCTSVGDWVGFAKKIQDAGADALELNIYFLPEGKDTLGTAIEKHYLSIAAKVREVISIPISVKMAKSFTNIVYMADQLYYRKINGVVLFNRLYEPDINIDTLKMTSAEVFSRPSDIRDSLRWVGIVSAEVPQIDVAASTGVHSGAAVVKQLLAGASVVEVCSAIYQDGPTAIGEMLHFVKEWMTKQGFEAISDFKGKMSYSSIAQPDAYERSQFMRYFSNHE